MRTGIRIISASYWIVLVLMKYSDIKSEYAGVFRESYYMLYTILFVFWQSLIIMSWIVASLPLRYPFNKLSIFILPFWIGLVSSFGLDKIGVAALIICLSKRYQILKN